MYWLLLINLFRCSTRRPSTATYRQYSGVPRASRRRQALTPANSSRTVPDLYLEGKQIEIRRDTDHPDRFIVIKLSHLVKFWDCMPTRNLSQDKRSWIKLAPLFVAYTSVDLLFLNGRFFLWLVRRHFFSNKVYWRFVLSIRLIYLWN